MRCLQACALAAAVLGLAACGGGNRESAAAPSDPSVVRDAGCASTPTPGHRAAACGYEVGASIAGDADEGGGATSVAPRRPEAPCRRPLEVVVYAASDWRRLARTLATGSPPCVTYAVSVAPVPGKDGTWTTPRGGVVEEFARLPGVTALAEIRVDGWQAWLNQHPGKTWFDAGVEARRRMAEAGYDPRGGNTWAVNELMLPVLTDLRVRADMTELIRGLYTGDGVSARGVVFTVVPFQVGTDVAAYRSQLDAWLGDRAFWAAMSRYVSVWADEVYVDSRACCVPGLPVRERAELMADYLLHRLIRAVASPRTPLVTRRFLERAYLPLGNAAWSWDGGFGNTDLPAGEMSSLIALQTYAMLDAAGGRPAGEARGRVGYGWAPRSADGSTRPTPALVDASQSLLDGLARSIHAVATTGRPQAACAGGACECTRADAAPQPSWRLLRDPG